MHLDNMNEEEEEHEPIEADGDHQRDMQIDREMNES
jgi:hypothetical protein|tara:strand:+ start:3210 stop:3317 length:108 start_codon:yes stop_codon:yes gene_type:complete